MDRLTEVGPRSGPQVRGGGFFCAGLKPGGSVEEQLRQDHRGVLTARPAKDLDRGGLELPLDEATGLPLFLRLEAPEDLRQRAVIGDRDAPHIAQHPDPPQKGCHGVVEEPRVREARRSGQSVFGVTIDTKSQATFSRIFGKSGFAVVSHPDKLTTSLPQLYRHLISQ